MSACVGGNLCVDRLLLCFSCLHGPRLISFFEILKFSIIGNFVKYLM